MYKLTLQQAIRLHTTNKDFMLFDLTNDNRIVSLKFTDDLRRYRNYYQHFKLIDSIKQQTELLNIY